MNVIAQLFVVGRAPVRAWACLFALVAICGTAAADTAAPVASADKLQIDQAQSRIEFSIGLLLFFDAEGVFESVDGTIDVQADQVVVTANIPVASASMSSERYEKMLEGPKFLDGEEHPQIEFTSDPLLRKDLVEGAIVPGTLCMRGQCRRESFDLVQLECEYDPQQLSQVCSMTVSGALKRSRYGMSTHRGALRNRIKLWMRLVAKSAAAPPLEPNSMPGQFQAPVVGVPNQ